jgi:hypothetical protein
MGLNVTGSPADGYFLYAQILAALDRQIRPTLRPGASVRYGPIAPWPLASLPAGSRAAANVGVTIAGDGASSWVSGVTNVTLTNVVTPPTKPSVLFFSDDPEYVQSDGLISRGQVDVGQVARLYYYHADVGVPHDLDVVLTATSPARMQIIGAGAGPDLDVMSVGHTVSRDFLLFRARNEGEVVDVVPGTPFILRHNLMLHGELLAGAADVHVLSGGPVTISVVSAPAGGRPEAYLNGPRLGFDGHNRHGTFDLDGYGALVGSYTVGGPDAFVKYGATHPTPHNLEPGDPGHDYGDYGIVHRITFDLQNPTDATQNVYLYEKPLGGPVRSSFLVDGQLKEVGCARLAQPYWFMTYQLPAHSKSASTTLTLTDGGSFYPIEFGVTGAMPVPYTPAPGSADGCSPILASSAHPAASPSAVPTATASIPVVESAVTSATPVPLPT